MASDQNPYYRGPDSDHFDGVRFFVPGHDMRRSARELLTWQLSGGRQPWPGELPNPPAPPPPARLGAPDDLAVTLIGQASALIQVGGLNILTDPFFSRRASPVQWAGPKRIRPPGVHIDDLPHIDVVLLSHNHYDHMDVPALAALRRRFDPRIVTPLGNPAILARADRRLHAEEGDWYDSFDLGQDVRVTLTPALHWSKRTLRDRNMALWSAFVIEAPGGPVYFAADTGYGDGGHFRDVRARFGRPRASLIPIGAYEPRWFLRDQHIDPDEAVRAHLDLDSSLSLAIHHATVQLTDEAVDRPEQDLARALARRGVAAAAFRAPAPGETVTVAPLASPAAAMLEATATSNRRE